MMIISLFPFYIVPAETETLHVPFPSVSPSPFLLLSEFSLFNTLGSVLVPFLPQSILVTLSPPVPAHCAQCFNRTLSVLVPDLPGYGGSSWKDPSSDDLTPYSWKNITSALALLLDHLNIDKAIFIGHDWGGFVVLTASLLPNPFNPYFVLKGLPNGALVSPTRLSRGLILHPLLPTT